jgi:hypothetical protein
MMIGHDRMGILDLPKQIAETFSSLRAAPRCLEFKLELASSRAR